MKFGKVDISNSRINLERTVQSGRMPGKIAGTCRLRDCGGVHDRVGAFVSRVFDGVMASAGRCHGLELEGAVSAMCLVNVTFGRA